MDVTATRNDRYQPIAPPTNAAPPKNNNSFDKLDAATAGATTALDPATLAAARDAAMTAKIDAYFNKAAAPYSITTPSGVKVSVTVPPQFRMNTGLNDAATGGLPGALGAQFTKDLSDAWERVKIGRGTPDDVAKLTTALIARGHLGAVDAKDAPAAIQALQWKYGIGVDCAGYVQRAFLAIRGKGPSESDRKAMGLTPLAANENFSSLPTNSKFKSIGVASARPGDIITLGAPKTEDVGHVVLVRSNKLLTPSESSAMGLKSGGPYRAIDVDSSWGAGSAGKGGGVQRRTWIYDEGTKTWSSWDPANKKLQPSTDSGPYDHPLTGIYRPKGES